MVFKMGCWLVWSCLVASVATALPMDHPHAHKERFQLTENPVEAGFCDTTKQLSGYFKIDGSKSKNYFYWFFESRHDPANDPVIIWLTGGPGCSSMLALFTENGPCKVNKDLSLENNPFSWNTKANIMWIDQPIGVGFSYGNTDEYDKTEQMVGDDMWHFLQSFFKAHPEYVKQPFYVFGESYGGHYVPAIAHRIFTANNKKEGNPINLQGLGIGNGLTDPQVQYKYYPDMAFNNTYNVKAVSESVYKGMKAAAPACTAMIAACQKFDTACLAAQAFCNAVLVAPYTLSHLNVYDVREKCEHPPLCYDFTQVEKFLRLPSTLEKLHVDTHHSAKWQACNMAVHAGFAYDWMKNFDMLVTPMTESGIRTLVYAGDADFIVNWLGCKAWTLALNWNKKEEFNAAPDNKWFVDGKHAGYLREVDAFSFLQVFNAGHMVPLNQPKNALAMLDAFIGKGLLSSTSQEPAQQEEKQGDIAEPMAREEIDLLTAVM